MNKDKIIRIRYKTYQRYLKVFPAMTDETLASYFDRLVYWLENTK